MVNEAKLNKFYEIKKVIYINHHISFGNHDRCYLFKKLTFIFFIYELNNY